MRFMLLLKGSPGSEAGVMPPPAVIGAMGKYKESMMNAGVLLDAAGLQASSKGARVRFLGNTRSVSNGPFTQTQELLAAYWVIQVKSRAEAIEWAKRCPPLRPGEQTEIELRQVVETSDFPEEETAPALPSALCPTARQMPVLRGDSESNLHRSGGNLPRPGHDSATVKGTQ